MFKKTKVRQILELLPKDLSAREISETFYSIERLNSAIRKVLDRLNDKPFQKRNGSRKTIYELEEKTYLRTLPMLPFEICEWSYNNSLASIYASHKLIAEHKRIPTGIRNAKVKEQALVDARTVLDIAGVYDHDILEMACSQALKDFYLITYNTLIPYVKKLQVLLDQADNLRDEILAWYTAELKSYDYRADAAQELFNPGTGTTVEGISELAIIEALSGLQIFNEVRMENMR